MVTPPSKQISAAPSVHQFPQPTREVSSVTALGGRLDSAPELGDAIVPVMFKWTHGGQRVFLTGTFNNWAKEGIPMVRSGQEFYQIIDVQKGVHEYKFLVDGEWKFSLDQPVSQDISGNVNNVVDIQYYERYEPAALQDPLDVVSNEEAFTTEIIDPTAGGGATPAEPPGVPPLLLRIPLMGLPCGVRGDTLRITASESSPSDPSSVNIPLFSISGHVSHDASVSFREIGTDTVLVSSCMRFAQKFSTTILATLNNSALSDGLPKHYGVNEAVGGSGHLFLNAVTGTKELVGEPKSVSLGELLPPPSRGILRRGQSSGTSRVLDISTFSD
jgi:hypothetical protein